MKKLLLILLCLPMIGFGQNVNIPDANFKAYLVGNTAINTNGDNEIQVSEATVFNGQIICSSMNIADLIGIEAFTNLTFLSCWANQLTSLDVSQNTNLTYLRCDDNQLTSLDVTQNTNLTDLHCYRNQLTSLDVTQNTYLIDLYCWENQLTSLDVTQNSSLNVLNCSDNQLTSLDVTQNTFLTYLICSSSQLTSIDLSQNTILSTLNCENTQLSNLDLRNGNNSNLNVIRCLGNTNLSCIDVDNPQFSLMNWTGTSFFFDPQHYFSDNCPSTTDLQEHTANKELLKVTDLLGRETKGTKKEPLLYIYDDGTVEKRIVIE